MVTAVQDVVESSYWRHLIELRRRERAAGADDLAAAERADLIVGVHVPSESGWCVGCHIEHRILTPHPCTTRRWADRTHIIARYTGEKRP